jgi:hypothetical protein
MNCRFLLPTVTLTAVAALGTAGCGSKSAYPVEGVVLLDGTPLEGATVVFEPEGQGQPAVSVTVADGSFRVSSTAGNGARAGDYRVTVTKVTGPQPGRPPWLGKGEPTDADRANWKREVVSLRAQQREWVPEVYTRKDTTPLRLTVPVKGKLRLELRGTPQAGGAPRPMA